MVHQQKTLRLGTRGSRLALVQAELACQQLQEKDPALTIDIIPISTSGDRNKDVLLAEIGGKALFVKEIDDALLNGRIDFAVHSLKDIPGLLEPGITIAGVLEREDARDAWISQNHQAMQALPHSARIGSSSPRRAAQLLNWRPDLEIVPLRGNVPTRVAKIRDGELHGTLLAVAGLKRLSLDSEIDEILSLSQMIPAVGQGIIALCCREDDLDIKQLLHSISHTETFTSMLAERALLAGLGGNCYTPIAAHAELRDGTLTLEALLASLDGKEILKSIKRGPEADAVRLGEEAAQELLSKGGDKIIALYDCA